MEWLLTRLEVPADVLWILGAGSVLMFIAGAIAVPFIVARLPADFYRRRREGPWVPRLLRGTPLRVPFLIVKNLLGLLLLAAGVLMLFLPGQGILTMLIALTLLDLPGKQAAETRMLRSRAVRAAIDWLRRRAGREPLSFLDEPARRE